MSSLFWIMALVLLTNFRQIYSLDFTVQVFPSIPTVKLKIPGKSIFEHQWQFLGLIDS